MKIALCAIGRYENAYAVEFVEHYKKLGFDKIFIYDNNYGDEEHFEEVLHSYIDGGFVEVVDWRDKFNTQRQSYEDCYAKHNKEYDWIAFYDFDEFLVINEGIDIHQFMRRAEGYDCMLINWMVMDDNDLVRYENKPMMERFTRPMPLNQCVTYSFPENNHVKSIVRGGIPNFQFRNSHRPQTPMRCCNAKGEPCRQKTFIPYDHSVAYLKHFTTKTIEEWLYNKVVRGYPDWCTDELHRSAIHKFFQRNIRTKEKEDFIKKWIDGGSVAAMALGRMGNQMFCAVAAATYARRTGRKFVGLVYEFGKYYDYNYPQGMFSTVMRNIHYLQPDEVSGFFHQEHGNFLCNGFPLIEEKNVVLNDFYQDARCIDRDIALEMFRPYDSILQEIRTLYGDVSDYVCVNVRRGDYLRQVKRGFRVLSKDDIDNILSEHFPNDKILFVSDDIQWCKDNFVGERYAFADKPCHYKPEMDLYLQTQCKGNVIANSTFSWWGAFLNERGGKVVCPWPWFSEGKINAMEHILPDNWTRWEMGNDYVIWITYHKDELIQEYGLREDKHHRLFAAHKPVQGDNINFLNTVYSELVTIYYVWKNQIKSRYVGFNHYRRQFAVTRLPNESECQIFRAKLKHTNIYSQYAKHHNPKDMDAIFDILNKRYGVSNPYVRSIRDGNVLLACNCFLMSWANFNKLCEFVFPVLFEFAQVTGCYDDVEKWRAKAVRDFSEEDATYQMRIQGFIAERLISAWIITHLNYYR